MKYLHDLMHWICSYIMPTECCECNLKPSSQEVKKRPIHMVIANNQRRARRYRLNIGSKAAREYLHTQCMYVENNVIPRKELYESYVNWATTNSRPIATYIDFGKAIDRKMVNNRVYHGVNCYNGIALKTG